MSVFTKIKNALRGAFQHHEPKPEKSEFRYQQLSNTDSFESLNLNVHYKMSVVPRWNFTNQEVRKWLETLFVEKIGCGKLHAANMANQYEGTGRNFFMASEVEWLRTFKHARYGREIYQQIREILHDLDQFSQTNIPLECYPDVFHKEFFDAKFELFNDRNVRPVIPTFKEDLTLNGHIYFLCLISVLLGLLLAKITYPEFSNWFFCILLIVVPYYGLVWLHNWEQTKRGQRVYDKMYHDRNPSAKKMNIAP